LLVGAAISSTAKPITAWALTTGEAGMRTQARGLAKGVTPNVVEKIVAVRWPWAWLPAGFTSVLDGVDPAAGDALEPPWPDLIVTCGRRSSILGVAVKKRAGGKPVLVHLQDPLTSLKQFDLVIAMVHDRIEGPKVHKVLTSLHDMTPERLAEARPVWAERLGRLPRPLIGVLLGGPSRRTPFGAAEALELQRRLATLRAKIGGGLVIVPSRRTADEALQVFAEAANGDPGLWVWDRSGDNPYVGVLALADRFVVTGDSVSMVSEALATDKPVEIFAARMRKRHVGFVDTLIAQGHVRWFDGEVAPAMTRKPIDTTGEAAAAVKQLFERRA
jgi:mitochondrial fission protein ELM1